jgi:hypothetical protein
VDVLYWIFSFFLPLVAMTCLNCRLIVAYRRILKKRAFLRGSTASRDAGQPINGGASATPPSASCTPRAITTDVRGESRLASTKQQQTNGGAKHQVKVSSVTDENNITMVRPHPVCCHYYAE